MFLSVEYRESAGQASGGAGSNESKRFNRPFRRGRLVAPVCQSFKDVAKPSDGFVVFFLGVGQNSVLPLPEFRHEFPEFLTHFFEVFLMALFRLVEAPSLAFEKLNLDFEQTGKAPIKRFELLFRLETFFFRLETVDSILFLSRCQTSLALNDELDGSIQFFGCHDLLPGKMKQRATSVYGNCLFL